MSDRRHELPDNIKKLISECKTEHVRVVQAILSGDYSSNSKAYQSVYKSDDDDSAKASVSRMLTIVNVSALYEALKHHHIIKGILSRDEAMKILSDMARTSIDDFIEFKTYQAGEDDEGNPVNQTAWSFKDSGQITPEAMRSIMEVNATPQGLKLKQHDQKAAIKQLAEMAGWEAPKRHEVGIGETEIAGDLLYKKK